MSPRGRIPGALALAALALTAGLGAGAGGVRAQSLEEALAAAYNKNPRLQAARAQLRATDEQVPQALSGYRPTVTANINRGRSGVSSSTAFFSAEENRNLRTYQLEIDQPLYRGGRTVAGTSRAENQVRAERGRLTATEQDVLLAAVTGYMDVFRDQAVLRLTINNEQVLRRRLEATRDQFEVGEVTRTDVSQAEARLAGATAERIRAEGDLESSRAVYLNVVGEPAGDLAKPPPVDGLPVTEEAARAASEANPIVRAAVYDENAARDQVEVVTGELLPTLSLNGQFSRGEDTFSRGSINETAQVTAELRLPLYQAGSVYARVREARQVALQRRNEVEDAKRNAAEDATQAWQALESARAQIESFQSQIRANEIALEGVRQEAEVGSRTILDILDAQQELLDSRVNLVRAERDATVAAFQLKAAIGRLTAADLGLPVALYDAGAHLDEVRGKFWGVGEDLPPPEGE